MIVTLVAAALAGTQPSSATAPVMDHSKMDHEKVDHGAMGATPAKVAAKMDCCKEGCSCCAKEAKPVS